MTDNIQERPSAFTAAEIRDRERLAQQEPGQDDIDASGVIPKVVLLWVLGYKIGCGECPDSAEVLAGAKEVEPVLFAQWTSRAVGRALGQSGCVTVKRHRRRDYSRVTLADLRAIEKTYDLDLGLPNDGGQDRPETMKE